MKNRHHGNIPCTRSIFPFSGQLQTPLSGRPSLAQAHGATLVGMGTILWLARGATGQGLIAVLAGNLVVQVLSLVVVVRTMALGAGAAVAPGVVIHVVLGGLFLFFLLKARQALDAAA